MKYREEASATRRDYHGDKAISPYRSGPKLVGFFNDFGTDHTYGQGFPSRWSFAETCIRQFNDTPTLKKIIWPPLTARFHGSDGV